MFTVDELIAIAESGGLDDLVEGLREDPEFAALAVNVINSALAEDEEPTPPAAPGLTPDQLARVHALMREEQSKLIARIKASRRHEVVSALR